MSYRPSDAIDDFAYELLAKEHPGKVFGKTHVMFGVSDSTGLAVLQVTADVVDEDENVLEHDLSTEYEIDGKSVLELTEHLGITYQEIYMHWIKYNGGQYKVNDDGSWVAIYGTSSSSSWPKNTVIAQRDARRWIDNKNKDK